MSFFISWSFFSILVGAFARDIKHKDFLLWTILAFVLSPILAFTICLCMAPNKKRCPYCWRYVANEASKCCFCHSVLNKERLEKIEAGASVESILQQERKSSKVEIPAVPKCPACNVPLRREEDHYMCLMCLGRFSDEDLKGK